MGTEEPEPKPDPCLKRTGSDFLEPEPVQFFTAIVRVSAENSAQINCKFGVKFLGDSIANLQLDISSKFGQNCYFERYFPT